MEQKKRIVSFDLDQTLLSHSTWKIPDSAVWALEKLRQSSWIILATGRDMDNYYSREFKEMVKPDGIIHLNGTKITVGNQLIYEHVMDKDLLLKLMKYADEKGYSLGLTAGDEDYYLHPEEVRAADIRRWGECGRQFKDPWKLLHMKVKTLAYLGNEAGALDMEKQFPQLKFPMFAGKEGADVVEIEASKAEGLKRLCAYFNVPLRDTVAFGDSMNDYEILMEAGTGVAMGNSVSKLKEIADYITTDIEEDGVWNACLALNLFEK